MWVLLGQHGGIHGNIATKWLWQAADGAEPGAMTERRIPSRLQGSGMSSENDGLGEVVGVEGWRERWGAVEGEGGA